MPEVSDEEYTELQQLRSKTVTQELEVAKANFAATNPHIPRTLMDAFQGAPEDVGKFGEALVAQFPKPEPQAAPAGSSSSPPPAQPVAPELPNPAASAQTLTPQAVQPAPVATPAPAQPGTPPIMATQFPPPQTAAEAQAQYNQQISQVRGMQPAPSPGAADVLDQSNANALKAEQIHERMRMGLAKPEEVLWLSQWGPKGFASAMTTHGRKVAARLGAS